MKIKKVPMILKIRIDEHLFSDAWIIAQRMGYLNPSELFEDLLRKWIKAMKTSPHVAFATWEA